MNALRDHARRWLRQGENDLSAARLLARRGFPAQACFMAHQSAEKALKAVDLLDGNSDVTGHSLSDLLSRLQQRHPRVSEYTELARRLDRYYIATRYPSDRADAAPFELFSRDQANEATDGVRQIFRLANDVAAGWRRWWTWPSALFKMVSRRR